LNRFEDCLKKGRLKRVEASAETVAGELRTALQELERSRVRYANGAWSESLMQGYFAAYRAARAALLASGYRDTNLFGLCAGLEHTLVEPGRLPGDEIRRLCDAKDRKDIVYEGDARASAAEADEILRWSSGFVRRMIEILALPGFDPQAVDRAPPPRGPARPSLPPHRE